MWQHNKWKLSRSLTPPPFPPPSIPPAHFESPSVRSFVRFCLLSKLETRVQRVWREKSLNEICSMLKGKVSWKFINREVFGLSIRSWPLELFKALPFRFSINLIVGVGVERDGAKALRRWQLMNLWWLIISVRRLSIFPLRESPRDSNLNLIAIITRKFISITSLARGWLWDHLTAWPV